MTTTAFFAGSLVGAAVLGSVLAGIGALIGSRLRPHANICDAVAILVCLLAVAFDLRPLNLRLPTVHRQVNEDWLNRYRGWVYGFGFGVQLGVGLLTIVTSAAVYAACALEFVTGMQSGALSVAIPAGAVIALFFGLARAAPLLAFGKVNTPQKLWSRHRMFLDRGRIMNRVAIVGLILTASTLGARNLT